MKVRFISVSTKGQLVIPTEMRSQLGIRPGTRIAVTLQDRRIILEPVSEDLVDRTLGILGGGPSLADELQRERRAADRW